MKTRAFFILCLLSGIGLTQLSAQKWPLGSHNVPTFAAFSGPWDIYCDGVKVDVLDGTVTTHVSQFIIPGPDPDGSEDILVWGIVKCSGTLTSIYAPYEVFKVEDVDILNRPLSASDTYTHHGIFKGNQGHTYNVWGHFDTSTWEYFIDKSICH
jgi:hypothetical protein